MSSAALRDGTLIVPVIDITSFRMPYADQTVRAGIVRQVDEAARTVGFMQITGHGIPAATLGGFTTGPTRSSRSTRRSSRSTAARPASTAATPRRRRRACPRA